VSRRYPKGLETRERIMETALLLFAERGYSAVTVEDIADAAGVTKGAVYYWFADKDDLGRDLQHELYERLTTLAVAEFDPGGDIVANMRRAFDVFLQALGTSGHARFFLRDAWIIPALDEAGRRDQAAATDMVRGVLSAAIARGQINPLDPDALAHVLVGALNEATLYVLTTGKREEAERVVTLLMESLRPGGPSWAGSTPAHDESRHDAPRRATRHDAPRGATRED